MPAMATIGDDGRLSPNTYSAAVKDFLLRSEYNGGPGEAGGEALPSHFNGATAEHQWTSPVYNQGSPSLALIRGGIAAALFAGYDYEIVALGDSKTEGYNTGARPRWLWSWPGQLRTMLGGVEGTVVAFTADPRWTFTNMQIGSGSAVLGVFPTVVGQPASAALVYATPHMGGSFDVQSTTGGTVTVTVDGGAAQPFTVPAGPGYHRITPAVTGTGTHTYVVTHSSDIHLLGLRPTYANPCLKVTNLGRSGATALYWRPGYRADGTGLWETIATTDASAIIGALGTNQPGMDGPANAVQLTGFWADVAALDLPAIICTPGGLDLTGAESWFEQYRAQMEAADAHNFALIDDASVIGTGADAQARGLMADSVHENTLGYAYEAATRAHLLAAPRP